MHLSDVKTEFSDIELNDFLENAKVSQNNTKVSIEVSNRAHHAKSIGKCTFDMYYLPNIENAIARANQFATDYPDILDKLGTNLPQLFATLGYNAC